MSGMRWIDGANGARHRLLKAACATVLMATVVVGGESGRSAQADDVLTVPGDHDSLSAAVDAASDGDTILIDPGVYEETDGLEISKSLTIMGADRKDWAELSFPDLALTGNGKSWVLANLIVSVESGLVVAGGDSDASRNSFSAHNCGFVAPPDPFVFGLQFYGDLEAVGTEYYGDLVVERCHLSGFFGMQVGGFAPPQISDIGSLSIERSTLDGVFVGLNLANASYGHAPLVAHNQLAGEIGMFMGRGQYDGAIVEHNVFVARDGYFPPETEGIAGIIVDEDHFGDNPDGRVRDSVFLANRVRGAGENAIVVDDAEDNVFRGNNVNDFESLDERVIFGEDTSGNYYFGNPNLVSDNGQNTISGRR